MNFLSGLLVGILVTVVLVCLFCVVPRAENTRQMTRLEELEQDKHYRIVGKF